MKKILILATLVAGLAVGLSHAEESKAKGKGKGGDPAKRAEMMIKQLDKDGDGLISKEEYLAGPMASKAKENGRDPEKMFQARDTNKDGKLDKDELAAAPRGKGPGKGSGKGKGPGKGGPKAE